MGSDFPVLVPAYNEARTIGDVVLRCQEHSSLVLVVDDGSLDNTASVAKKHGAVVLSNSRNEGLGASLRRGFSYLFQQGYKYVVTVDGDGVHEPEFIPQLVRTHLTRRADLTIGSRFMRQNNTTRQIPSPKRAANRFATALVNRVLGGTLTDVASGMRVIGERILTVPLEWDNFAIAYELVSTSISEGLRIEECPISVYYNPDILFCTKRKELCDLLKFALLKAEEPVSRGAIGEIIKRVETFESLRIILGCIYFALHPLRDYDSYVFQDSDHAIYGPHWLEIL